jgi:hypothetical protein
MAVVRIVAAATIGMGMVAAMVFLGLTAISGVDTADAVEVPGIPVQYLRLYQQAAHDYDLDWAVLAGIGRVETDHGRVQNGGCAVSSMGARGPMQFMPGTWADYGAGGDICDPADAIPAAARYLVASGAPGDYHAAILAYNHSERYYTDGYPGHGDPAHAGGNAHLHLSWAHGPGVPAATVRVLAR